MNSRLKGLSLVPGSEKVLGRWWLQWWWWKLRWKVGGWGVGREQKKKGVWGETGVEEEEGHGVDVQTKIPYFNLPSTCLARKSISIPVRHLSLLPPYLGYKIALLRQIPEQRRNKLVKWFFNLTSSQTEAMAPPTAQQRHCPCSSRADNKCKSTGWGQKDAVRNIASKMLCPFPISPLFLSPENMREADKCSPNSVISTESHFPD